MFGSPIQSPRSRNEERKNEIEESYREMFTKSDYRPGEERKGDEEDEYVFNSYCSSEVNRQIQIDFAHENLSSS